MAHFFKLQDQIDAATREFFEMTQAASDNRPKDLPELKSATMIQSVWRASQVRGRWHSVVHATVLVQRIGRGWLARARTQMMRDANRRRQNLRFHEHCATVFQKVYRGWWSRRNLHDFYGRKDYLAKVEKRGEYTVEYLAKERQQRATEAKLHEEEQMRQEFDSLAGELHHLVSTKTIAGVYNPPYSDVLPSAFDRPIEQHLRDCCTVQVPRSLRRPKHKVLGASPRHDPGASANGITQAEVRALSGSKYGPPQDPSWGTASRTRPPGPPTWGGCRRSRGRSAPGRADRDRECQGAHYLRLHTGRHQLPRDRGRHEDAQEARQADERVSDRLHGPRGAKDDDAAHERARQPAAARQAAGDEVRLPGAAEDQGQATLLHCHGRWQALRGLYADTSLLPSGHV
ncbi:unnamed protein product [Prorocentrum cordatum]|uniref:Spermatogenesis-associated protein 17 n=1 Tax=Prorocentrum cordatum TaxID=2364126 RepID=A0ABN9XHH6_9DINO|nr:unnamed protein product [Polarella glacialis]